MCSHLRVVLKRERDFALLSRITYLWSQWGITISEPILSDYKGLLEYVRGENDAEGNIGGSTEVWEECTRLVIVSLQDPLTGSLNSDSNVLVISLQ